MQGHGVLKDRRVTYAGNFVKGMKEGNGTLTWPDGGEYKGEFKKNFIHGKGTQKWADGRVYEGDWY